MLSLLGAAGERIGYDRWLKANPVKRRTHSLFRQGLMLYHHLPNWPDDRIRPLMGTMEEELNEAGARGYRFLATQGGETAFGGSEAVVVMTLDPEGRRFRYILLATNRTGTMQREMNEAPPEYSFAGMTVFDTRFGGNEAAVILEAEITDD